MTRFVTAAHDAYWRAEVLGSSDQGLRIRWIRGPLAGWEALVPREYLRKER